MLSPVFHINQDNCFLYTIDNFLPEEYAEFLFNESIKLPLEHNPTVKTGVCHRNVGLFSDTVPYYQFSGQKTMSKKCPEFLNQLLKSLNLSFEKTLQKYNIKTGFNAMLINDYVTGEDYIGSHADSEKDVNGVIILALTTSGHRKFRIRRIDGNKINGENFYDVITQPGQLLVMEGDFQKMYKHEVPIEKTCKDPHRLSITVRCHNFE